MLPLSWNCNLFFLTVFYRQKIKNRRPKETFKNKTTKPPEKKKKKKKKKKNSKHDKNLTQTSSPKELFEVIHGQTFALDGLLGRPHAKEKDMHPPQTFQKALSFVHLFLNQPKTTTKMIQNA